MRDFCAAVFLQETPENRILKLGLQSTDCYKGCAQISVRTLFFASGTQSFRKLCHDVDGGSLQLKVWVAMAVCWSRYFFPHVTCILLHFREQSASKRVKTVLLSGTNDVPISLSFNQSAI